MPDKKQLHAIYFLGREFFIHIAKKYILRRKSPGYDDFLEFYADDRTVPLTDADREKMPAFAACVTCEMCDPVCPVMKADDSTRFSGPMDIACCISRDLTLSGDWPDPFLSTLCGACDYVCPQSVPVSDIIIYLRRKNRLTNPAGLPDFYNRAAGNLKNGLGVFGKTAPASGESKGGVLYWRGCREAAEGSEEDTKLLEKLGIEYTTIEEGCCGGLPDEMGLDYDPSPVLERIKSSGAERIVTACPVCADSLRAKLDLEVQLIPELLFGEKPPENALSGKKAAFHDPCRMPRRPQTWEPPRALLQKMGAKPVEIEREREKSECCGAGGGLLETDPDLAGKTARNRIEQVMEAGADILVTSCPLCAKHLASAVKEGERLEVMTLTQAFLTRQGARSPSSNLLSSQGETTNGTR